MAVDWSERGGCIAKHDVTVEMADDALDDPDAVVFSPDCNSKSGTSDRIIGFSTSAADILNTRRSNRWRRYCSCRSLPWPGDGLLRMISPNRPDQHPPEDAAGISAAVAADVLAWLQSAAEDVRNYANQLIGSDLLIHGDDRGAHSSV